MPLQNVAPRAREMLSPLQASSSVLLDLTPPTLLEQANGLPWDLEWQRLLRSWGWRDRGVLQGASLRAGAAPQMCIRAVGGALGEAGRRRQVCWAGDGKST